jgi:hypothetical protein
VSEEHVGTTWKCLSELENEYLRIGTEHCDFLEQRTQLSAFLQLGIRAVSLLRGMLRILEPDFLDSYDPIRRAFIETWQLEYQFRLRDGTSNAQKWLQGDGGSWRPDFQMLEESNGRLNLEQGQFAREFNLLSEVAHPTLTAAQNSCAIASTLRGLNPNTGALEQTHLDLSVDYLNLVNRQIWVTLITADHLADLPIAHENLSACTAFHEAHTKLA